VCTHVFACKDLHNCIFKGITIYTYIEFWLEEYFIAIRFRTTQFHEISTLLKHNLTKNYFFVSFRSPTNSYNRNNLTKCRRRLVHTATGAPGQQQSTGASLTTRSRTSSLNSGTQSPT
jgi:hypothetical protein